MSDTVQMEALGRIRDTNHSLEIGDRATVPRVLAEYWAAQGWAKPVSEDTGITVADKKPGAKRVSPDLLRHVIRTPEA